MSIVVFALIVLLLVAVIAIVSSPLRAAAVRRARSRAGAEPGEVEGDAPDRRERDARAAELAAAREAKYQEIRDAELDYRTGKLSRDDYEAVDATLRAEAIAILDQIAELERGRLKPTGA